MKINELKRIVKENRYVMIESNLVIFIYGYSHGGTEEFKTEIRISKLRTKDIDIKTGIYCEVEEFNMIKAAVEFAETPLEDREEENKFYDKHMWKIKNQDKIIYMLYDWTDECIKLLTHDKTKIFAKIGEDTLNGEIIDNYKIIEINLDEVEDD